MKHSNINTKLTLTALFLGLLLGLVAGISLKNANATNKEVEPVFRPIVHTMPVDICGRTMELNPYEVKTLLEGFYQFTYSYYQFKDYEEFNWKTFEKERPYTYWDDCITEYWEFDVVDSIITEHGGWGDFYTPIDE